MPHMLKAGYVNIACSLNTCTTSKLRYVLWYVHYCVLRIVVCQQTWLSLTTGIFFIVMWKCKTNIWDGEETTAKNSHQQGERYIILQLHVTKNHCKEVIRRQPTKGCHVRRILIPMLPQYFFNFLTHTCTERITTRAWELCCHIKHQGIPERSGNATK